MIKKNVLLVIASLLTVSSMPAFSDNYSIDVKAFCKMNGLPEKDNAGGEVSWLYALSYGGMDDVYTGFKGELSAGYFIRDKINFNIVKESFLLKRKLNVCLGYQAYHGDQGIFATQRK